MASLSKSSPMLFLLLCLACFAHRIVPCRAQNNPQDYLSSHNAARKAVNVPNMVWNATLASYANNYVMTRLGDCNLVHSDPNGPYGENLAKGTGSFSGVDAVNLWVKEKSCYNYNTNECVGGECLHYTQVVWRDSAGVGCARLKCNNGWWFVSCNYYPPGNWEGEKPY